MIGCKCAIANVLSSSSMCMQWDDQGINGTKPSTIVGIIMEILGVNHQRYHDMGVINMG